MHKHITVYQTDRDGLYLYETTACEFGLDEGVYNVPFGAFEDAPPIAPAGRVARRVGNAWKTVEDYRSTALWVAETKAPYVFGTVVEASGKDVSYPGWGPLPAWLTDVQPV